jgi:hypothetical protein
MKSRRVAADEVRLQDKVLKIDDAREVTIFQLYCTLGTSPLSLHIGTT